MNLFLDSSVLLAACGSTAGASSEIFRRSPDNNWALIVTPYVIEEVSQNLGHLPTSAMPEWARLRPLVLVMDDVVTLDRPDIFGPAKDRPILFSALAWADILLTLDRNDCGGLMDQTFYGLHVSKPGAFLERERSAGRLR